MSVEYSVGVLKKGNVNTYSYSLANRNNNPTELFIVKILFTIFIIPILLLKLDLNFYFPNKTI